MILGTGATLWVATTPFYAKHKALANLNSYVHFPVEFHLQLFTTVSTSTTKFCILYGGQCCQSTGAVTPIAPMLPQPMHAAFTCRAIDKATMHVPMCSPDFPLRALPSLHAPVFLLNTIRTDFSAL